VQTPDDVRTVAIAEPKIADAAVGSARTVVVNAKSPGITTLVESFAAMGAPWLSGIRDIRSFARDLGLDLLENFQTSELCRTYRHDRPIASPIFGFYSVCTLGS